MNTGREILGLPTGYEWPFDREADRKAFLERAEHERRERKRRQQAIYDKQRKEKKAA